MWPVRRLRRYAGHTITPSVHQPIGVIFVDIDAGQDVTLTGNNYFNRSGTLDALPFRYHGTSYATFEAYQAAVEPTATNVDPDL